MIAKSLQQNEVSQSEERHTFQMNTYVARCKKEGKEVDPAMIAMYESWQEGDAKRIADPEWRENNLEYDLRSTEWILEKARGDEIYAQHVYAAMCNMKWQKTDPWPILKDEYWSCSWRHAGGIVADMMETGDYIDWYCSGIHNEHEQDHEWLSNATEEQIKLVKKKQAHVGEGVVTDEIRSDFLKLGWQPADWPSDDTA
jgi:hypothetical protein